MMQSDEEVKKLEELLLDGSDRAEKKKGEEDDYTSQFRKYDTKYDSKSIVYDGE